MSDACVTDSFARAKEAWSGLIRSPYPMEAQAAGRIHPLKVCVTAAAVVNPGCALTDFNAEEAAGSPLCDAGHDRQSGSSTRSNTAVGLQRATTSWRPTYLAFIQLASIRLWLRVNESTP